MNEQQSLHAQTGSFDVHKCKTGSFSSEPDQSTILIKKLRRCASIVNAITQALLSNVKTQWSGIQEEAPAGVYIAELIPNSEGVATRYYEHGNVLQYHLKNPNANLLPLVVDCARTLAYLHTKGVVHGNVCTRNFLVDSLGHAYLSDIGIHEVLRTDNFTDAWRYLPFTVEYMEDQWLNITAIHDVHAFGMMMYELYAKQKPFHHLKDVPQTLPRIVMGLPSLTQPPNTPDQIWKLVQDCITDTTPRPTMHDVEQSLISILKNGGE